MTAKDELAKLKREVEELKTKLSAPKSEPFVPEPYQRFDPTAGMSMPPSALAAMVAAVPDHMVRDIAMRDGCAPTGPSAQGAIPSSQTITGVRPGGGSGWAREIPLGPPPGVAQADRLMDAQDARDRAELVERDARFKAMQKLAEGKP